MLLQKPFPMLPSRKVVSGAHVRQPPGARATSIIRCCDSTNDKPKEKAIPTQVFNITGGEVHIHNGEGRGQVAEWDAVAMSPEAKALLQRHAVKASTALKMHNVLGFEDVGDLQHLSSDLIAQLKLKPLQLEPLMHMLRDQQNQQDDPLMVGMQGRQQQQQRGALDMHACVVLMKGKAGAEGAVHCVAIAPDGRRAVTAGPGSELQVWNLETRSWIATLQGHTGDVFAVAFTPDGRQAVSSSEDKTLRVWDLDTYACTLSKAMYSRGGRIRSVAITPDGQHALFGYATRLCKWAMDDSEAESWGLGPFAAVTSVAVSPDGRLAVIGGYGCGLLVWDLDAGVDVGTLAGHADMVTSVAITPDGRHAVSAACGEEDALRVWDLATRTCIGTMEGHEDEVTCVAITPDGRRAVSGSMDCKLRVWDLATFTCTGIMEEHGSGVLCVAITPDGRHAVSAGLDGDLRMWDLGPSAAHS